jgi:hypothetical protein
MKKPSSQNAHQPLFYLGIAQWQLIEPYPRELWVDLVTSDIALDAATPKKK